MSSLSEMVGRTAQLFFPPALLLCCKPPYGECQNNALIFAPLKLPQNVLTEAVVSQRTSKHIMAVLLLRNVNVENSKQTVEPYAAQ